jgi:hypothetical protein
MRTLTSPSLNKPSWSMRSCSKADRCRLARRDDADRLYQTVPGRRRPYRMLSADGRPEVLLENIWCYGVLLGSHLLEAGFWTERSGGSLIILSRTDRV